MLIRFCRCNLILTSRDIREGIPCGKCREKIGLKFTPLNKVEHRPNPAQNIWAKKQGD